MADDQNWTALGRDRRDPQVKAAQHVVDTHFGEKNYSSPTARIANPDSYITPDGQSIKPDVSGNNFLYSREGPNGTEYSNIAFGTDGTEEEASGTIFDDTFVLGQNFDSKNTYGSDPVEHMRVYGNEGVDRLVLPGKLADYNIVPPELTELPDGDIDHSKIIVLQLKEPNEEGLKRIVVYDVEKFVFAGDDDPQAEISEHRKTRTAGLRDEIKSARDAVGEAEDTRKAINKEENPEGYAAAEQAVRDAEAHYEYIQGQRLPNPVDLDAYLENSQPEQVSLEELRTRMLNRLTPEQRGAYAMLPDLREGLSDRQDVIRRLTSLKTRLRGEDVERLETKVADAQKALDEVIANGGSEYSANSARQFLESQQGFLEQAQESLRYAQDHFSKEFSIAKGDADTNIIRIERNDGSVRELVVDPPLSEEELAMIESESFDINTYQRVAEIYTEDKIPGWGDIKIPTFRDGPQDTTNLDPVARYSPDPIARPGLGSP